MDRLRRLFDLRPASATYEPLEGGSTQSGLAKRFSWIEYMIFMLLGVAMLWAWNMFLAAAPYFQVRFTDSEWLLAHFQPGILTVSTIVNMISMLLLTKFQQNASYPRRVVASLVLNIICFTLLALSTVLFLDISPNNYFAFLILIVGVASLAAGLFQNGLFALVSGFGMSEYTQAIMTGQGIAGVLPCIVQIISVLSVSGHEEKNPASQESSTSAFAYFLTATGISTVALLAFLFLLRQHSENSKVKAAVDDIDATENHQLLHHKTVGMWTLFLKLRWLAMGVFVTFVVTMFFPVFTPEIDSVQPENKAPRLLQHASFIPLAFLTWNAGDLLGRMAPLVPWLNIVHSPRLVFFLSLLRFIFIPLYYLCNIHNQGAVIPSDLFYLFAVQLPFGVSNGFLGSICMMGASQWVDAEESEAAGGFMGLMLVGGLTVGSLLSFAVVDP